jgi:aminoglycoside phosphotransferase (APT) family kinase protein
MTRVPGEELGAVYGSLSDDQKESIFRELKTYLHTMRQWPNPCGGSRICSIAGMEIRSVRVPMHKVDPCENENMYSTNCLISTAYAGTFPSEDAYREARNRAEKIRSMPHQVLFTHGDLKHHNIMVHKGHITGFLDWESAGWYPEYWEYTTALRFIPKDFW